MTRFTLCSRASILALAAALAGCGDTSPTAPDAGATSVPVMTASKLDGELVVLKARETICKFTPGEQRVVNGTLHFSGFIAETRIESADPRYRGESTVEFRGQRDVATGDGPGFGRFTTRPDKIAGTWEGKFSGNWAGGSFEGTSVAHGTGALRGQVLHGTLKEVPADPATTPCVPVVGTQFIETITIHAAPGQAR